MSTASSSALAPHSPHPLKLYDLELSGNCYKARLFLALIEQPHELIPVDFLAGAHKKPPLLDMNAFGEIPILVHGDLTLRDSQAILVYLARHANATQWFPIEARAMAEVMQWLMVAESEIARGPNDARLHDKFGYQLDHAVATARSTHVYNLLEAYLKTRNWLALDRPTIADIACFPYLALGHEGRVSCAGYPSIQAWIARIKALPNFVSMPNL